MRELPKLVVLQLLRAYKWAISPLFPPSCRYIPTCSEYAMEAVEEFGALRGGFKALLRLLRCHPLSRGGYDPVVPHPHLHNEAPTTNDQRQTTPVSYPGAMQGNC
jgi:uncharacterized protein